MNVTSNVPSHLLLNRKDDPANHSTRPEQRGASSAFASYGFGPVDTDSDSGDTSRKKVTGNVSGTAATGGVGWLTQLAVSRGA